MRFSGKVRQSKVIDTSLSFIREVMPGLDLDQVAPRLSSIEWLAWRGCHDEHSSRGEQAGIGSAQLFMLFCVLCSVKRRRHAALPTNMLANRCNLGL